MEPSVLDLLRRHARDRPGATAVSAGAPDGWESVTWAELCDAVTAAAGRARGLPGGGPVVLLVDNTVACVTALLGLAAAEREVLLVEAASSYLTDDQSAVVRGAAPCVVGPAELATTAPARLTYAGFDQLTAGPPGSAGPPGEPGDRGAIHQLTSGSTGEQRVVRHGVDNVLRGGRLYREVFGLTAEDTVFVTVPVAHSFGLVGGLAAALVSGATLMALVRFNLRVLLAGLARGATVVLSTPLGYELIASASRRGGGALRLALSSGGPLSERVAARAADRLGATVHQIYGSTETGLIACTYDRATPWPAGSVGRFAPGVERRMVRDDLAAEQGEGRLLVRTSTMFDGYLDAAPPGVGFYDTGDLVRVDDDGHLFVVARKNTFVNVGGRKINPRRIERVVAEHPAVAEIVVYGAETEGDEQEIHAAVVLGTPARVSDLLGFCRSRLMPYEVPHRVHVVSELPRTALGKVSVRRLREGA